MQTVADLAYTYNASGDLLSLSYTRVTGPAHTNPVSLAGYSWNYDAAGRITAFNSPGDLTSYAYDATNQLTGADHSLQDDESYTYDANGNRTMSGCSTTSNRMLSDGTYSYQYDAEGRRTRQTEIATGDTIRYEWDYRSRLTAVSHVNASNQATKRVRYTYDAFDRRIRKELDADGNGSYESSDAYVYDGSNIVLVADETGSLTNRYLHGPAVDQILADEQLSATAAEVLWALSDNQGTVRYWAGRNATTGQPQLVDRIQYSAYGEITGHFDTQTGQASEREIHYAYTGREWDADANLYYYRARWYDPHAGRFISEDPLGFAAGDTNVQRYVGNSPTNFEDPSGKKSKPTAVSEFTANSWTLGYWHAGAANAQNNAWGATDFLNPTSQYFLPTGLLVSLYGIATDVVPGGISAAGKDALSQLNHYENKNNDPISKFVANSGKFYVYSNTQIKRKTGITLQDETDLTVQLIDRLFHGNSGSRNRLRR